MGIASSGTDGALICLIADTAITTAGGIGDPSGTPSGITCAASTLPDITQSS